MTLPVYLFPCYLLLPTHNVKEKGRPKNRLRYAKKGKQFHSLKFELTMRSNNTSTNSSFSSDVPSGAESIRVLVRLRPDVSSDKKKYGSPCAAVAGSEGTAISLSNNGDSLDGTSLEMDENEFQHRLLQKPRVFTYDRVFGKRATQEQVFDSVSDLVDSVVHGYNATIFAYGATGSGKTFSMSGDDSSPGIVPRSIGKVFDSVQALAREDSETLFMVSMGFVELYNNTFIDLLSDCGEEGEGGGTSSLRSSRESNASGSGQGSHGAYGTRDSRRGSSRHGGMQSKKNIHQPRIELHESPTGGVHLTGSKTLRMPVRSAEQAMRLVETGNRARATAATNLNEHSSRSHSILTIHVESQRKVGLNEEEDEEGNMRSSPRIVCLGKMHLVDLAGSERIRMSGAEGMRAEEAVNINLSLSALGNVLSALSKFHVQATKSTSKNHHHRDGGGSKPRIPSRDSKLTYLLRDSLGGNSKTVMLTTVRAPVAFYQQTKMSLMYASRAKNIRNQTHINTDMIGNSEMQQVVGQVEQLRTKLLERKAEFQRLKSVESRSAVESRELRERLANLQQENDKER